MSFFGYLAAGAAEGVGKSISDEANYSEKLALQRELLQEKQAGELQRQRERLDDKSALALTLAGMKQDSAGGGGKGLNLFQLAQSADTPEKQTRLMESVRAFGGDDAANVLGRIFGKGDTETRTVGEDPLSRDAVNGLDKASDTAAGVVPQTFVERAKYDADKGRQSLQRLMAMVMDPAKLDAYSKGEAQLLRNDVTTNVTLPKVLKDPSADTSDVNDALTTLDPKAINQTGKNETFADRTAVLADTEQGRRDRATAGEDGRNSRAALAQARATYSIAQKAYNDATSKDRPAAQANLNAAKERLDNLMQKATQPAPANAAASQPRSPSAAASAFKAGQRY